MGHGTRRKIRHLYKSGVFTGFKKYGLPLLISYSRSGTNWIRYFVETVSGRPTPGHQRAVEGNDFVFDRAHAGFKVAHMYDKLILVLRDYKECLVRQHGMDRINSYSSVRSFLNDEKIFQPPIWYMLNILAFDRHQGPGLVLYYEDLVTRPEESFTELADFLGLESSKTNQFYEEIDTHRQRSVLYYQRNNESVTAGKTDSVNFYRETLLSEAQAEEFDQFFQEKNSEIFSKYLTRYSL